VIAVGAGRYHLERRIASGGMGEVWLARDTSLGRGVAVKLLHHSLSDDDRFRARFQAEARNAASLHDPHIATVFDYGDELDEQGSHRSYLVMEYVDGQPLSALLRGPVPQEQAANLVAQAAEGLAVAHAAGIVHRDVKPANFLVTPDRRVKITDFGVARARGSSSLTDTGTIIGTPSYVAPEVAEGREATPASDLYSLGVVLYECLAGSRPFTGDTPVAVAISHLRDEPPPLPAHISPPLRALTMQALAKDPAARPASAAAFAAALRAATDGDADAPTLVAAGPWAPGAPAPATSVLPAAASGAAVDSASGTAEPSRRERSRGMAWPLIAVAAAIILIVAAAVAISALNDDPEGASDAPGPGSGETSQRPSDQTPAQETDTTSSEPESSEPETTAPESSPSTETSPTEETAFVDAEEYIGDQDKDAEKALRDLGFKTTKTEVEGDGENHTVADVSPTGEVPLDTEITLFVWKNTGSESGPSSDDDDD
jgi:serine/threonine-protein kinase